MNFEDNTRQKIKDAKSFCPLCYQIFDKLAASKSVKDHISIRCDILKCDKNNNCIRMFHNDKARKSHKYCILQEHLEFFNIDKSIPKNQNFSDQAIFEKSIKISEITPISNSFDELFIPLKQSGYFSDELIENFKWSLEKIGIYNTEGLMFVFSIQDGYKVLYENEIVRNTLNNDPKLLGLILECYRYIKFNY